MKKLVLLRHGESTWNNENRFTGWTDVDLSEKGFAEAQNAGQLLREGGWEFDVAYTSVLKRAIRTLWITLDAIDQMWIPVHRHWRLNERHYGGLTGLNKAETAAKHGEEQVFQWRRSYVIPPPEMPLSDSRHPTHDRRYKGIPASDLPSTESLKDCVARVVPYWESTLKPAIQSGQRILIAAHGNSLRSLIKYLGNISDDAITELNIPTAIPLVYEFDDQMKPIRHYYLGDQAKVQAAMASVVQQGKAKK